MKRQAEDQGKVGGGVSRRYDCSQRCLEACPGVEDHSRFDGNDAIGDGSNVRG